MTFLQEAAILMLAAALAAPLSRWLRLGSVLGFVGVGVLIGPSALGLIADSEVILNFSEIGVVFLLFIIGLELHPKRLWTLRKVIFGTGTLQFLLTAAVIGGAMYWLEFSFAAAFVVGTGLALSSTAFALRLLADNGELQSAHGRLGFGILLFQDLAVIPLLAVLPFLIAGDLAADQEHEFGLLASLGIFVAYILAGRFLLIPFLRLVAWAGVSEAFTATALLLVLGSALVMEAIGLSMGLGAFMAGVLVAGSEYRHQLEADIDPFRGLLLGLFFMAVGMSTNLGVLASNPVTVVAGVFGLIAIKGIVLFALGLRNGLGRAHAGRLAAYLCQGGEFGFVIFTLAGGSGIITAELQDLLIMIVTVSMALTPLLLKLITLVSNAADDTEQDRKALMMTEEEDNNIIIAGFGRFGQILGRILTAQGIPFTAIDIDPSQVELVRNYGNKVYYGDPSRLALLNTAHADKAKVFAVCVGDVEASIKIVQTLKRHFPRLKILVRARNRHHEIRLRELQVDYVIRETLLSSLDLTGRVLAALGLSEKQVNDSIAAFHKTDALLLERQRAFMRDEGSMIQSSKEAARELSRLMHDEAAIKKE